METMLAKLRRNKAHLDKLEDTLASVRRNSNAAQCIALSLFHSGVRTLQLRAEGAQKQEQCSKELRNQEDVASAAEECAAKPVAL